MNRWFVSAVALAAVSCVKAPTAPNDPPAIRGNYVLTVTASAACRLTPNRLQWTVTATTVGTGEDAEIRVTLPEGDDAIDLALSFGADPNAPQDAPLTLVRGTLRARRAPLGGNFVTIDGNVRGTISAAGSSGQVPEGTLNGRIAISNLPEEQDRTGDSVGACTAADHQFSLVVP
jgi:hypothetical protein